MNYLSVIQVLNACHGPAGDEGQIASKLKALAEPYADSCQIDTMGNLIVRKKGNGPRLMFAAHMDSIGLIVTHIDEKGYLSFGKLGGIHVESTLHTPVQFKNGVCGVVASRGSADPKSRTIQDLYIDIGAKDREHAQRLVQVGDTAVSRFSPFVMGRRLTSPYLDNRISCAAMLDALERIRTHNSDLYFVFSAQEELGHRGSKPAAYAIDPDYGVVLDVTIGDELESKKTASAVLGGGAAIKIMDRTAICHPGMVRLLENLAKENQIPCQRDVITTGGTDADSIQLTHGGVPTGGISIPCRYLHSPVEVVDTDDVKAVSDLIVALAQHDFKEEL